jgi:hypothetical protein
MEDVDIPKMQLHQTATTVKTTNCYFPTKTQRPLPSSFLQDIVSISDVAKVKAKSL